MSARIARISFVLCLLAAVMLVAPAAYAAAPPVSLVAHLTASDGGPDEYFGFPVAISGDTMVIGAAWDDDGAVNTGSVYVFTRTAGVWTQTVKLHASDAAANDIFGARVAIDGGTIAVSAYDADPRGSNSGAVYIFTRSTAGVWSQQAKVTASDETTSDEFGRSVSLSGDTLVVASPYADPMGSESGAAYIFKRSTTGVWSQQAKLTGSDEATSDQFGGSVWLSNGTVVAGSTGGDGLAAGSGAAYVFTVSATGVWSQQAKLTASDGAADDQFGESVSLSGDTAVVGAPSDDDAGASSGSAYVFTRSAGAWSQKAKLTASDAAAGDGFGKWSIAIRDDIILAGAYEDDDMGVDSGSAYVFQRSMGVWSQLAKITALDGSANDHFGAMVAASADTLVLSADLDTTPAGVAAGSVYVYSLAVPTSITIQTNATTSRIGGIPILSGLVTPSSLVGKNIVVYVRKPGKAYWTYSSNRTVYSRYGIPSWQYKYYFKPGMAKGIYVYKAFVPTMPGL
ncbi:MAG TPA: FG-GAP repeat protein, partial [Coriobacteriia bacterium]